MKPITDTINQEIIEVQKGCGKLVICERKFDDFICGKKYRDASMMLCPTCQSKLTQLTKFKKMLEQLECDNLNLAFDFFRDELAYEEYRKRIENLFHSNKGGSS